MFFITCFEKAEKIENGWTDLGAVRTFGFKATLDEATRALNDNVCDMHECLYLYAVVEEMNPGIHPEVISKTYFKFDFEKKGFFEIKQPVELSQVTNIALG